MKYIFCQKKYYYLEFLLWNYVTVIIYNNKPHKLRLLKSHQQQLKGRVLQKFFLRNCI